MAEDIASAERRIEEALSKTSPIVIGQRIKASRIQQGISVRDLAERAKISKTSVVNLEQGRCRPLTILKVCVALGLHIERFLDDDQVSPKADVAIHRREDDRWFNLSDLVSGPLIKQDRPLSDEERNKFHHDGIVAQMLMFKSRFPDSNFWIGIIELSGPSEAREHPGEEFVYVLDGSAQISVGKELYKLEKGESICLDPRRIHSYAPTKGEKTSLLCVRINRPGT